MSLNRRLSAMETSGPIDATAFEYHGATLAAMLGEIDGLLHPDRSGAKSVFQQQRDFLQFGLRWQGSSGGGSSRAWKSDERQRAALVRAAMIEISRTGSVPRFRILPTIEYRLRSAIGLPCSREGCFVLLAMLGRNDHDSENIRPGGWVAETAFGFPEFETSELFATLLVAGCVESRPTTAGRIYYRRTGIEFDWPAFEPCDYRADWADHYSDSFCRVVRDRRSVQPMDPDEVFIPLSATR